MRRHVIQGTTHESDEAAARWLVEQWLNESGAAEIGPARDAEQMTDELIRSGYAGSLADEIDRVVWLEAMRTVIR